MTFIRIAGQGQGTDHEVAKVGHRKTRLDLKLVAFVRFALADALHLQRMQIVKLVDTEFFLHEQPASHVRLIGKDLLRPHIGGTHTFNVAHHQSKTNVQLANLAAHPSGLPGMTITVNPI